MFIPSLELPYFLPGINSTTQRISMHVKGKSILSVARRAAFGDLEKPLSQELCIYLSMNDRSPKRKATDTEIGYSLSNHYRYATKWMGSISG